MREAVLNVSRFFVVFLFILKNVCFCVFSLRMVGVFFYYLHFYDIVCSFFVGFFVCFWSSFVPLTTLIGMNVIITRNLLH